MRVQDLRRQASSPLAAEPSRLLLRHRPGRAQAEDGCPARSERAKPGAALPEARRQGGESTINVEAEAANRVRWLLTTPAYGTAEELVSKVTRMLMQAGEEQVLQAMREPEVFECMALDCLEHLGATRDNESSDDEEYKGQEASEACHWYSKGMLALQESKQVRRGRSEAQWEAVRAALGERGMQLQADGSWFPSWDDASEVGYLSGAEVEAQAVQAAMLISLQESTEASVEAATAMEVQEVSAEQQNELCGQMTAQLESVMAATERIEHEQWADYVFAERAIPPGQKSGQPGSGSGSSPDTVT